MGVSVPSNNMWSFNVESNSQMVLQTSIISYSSFALVAFFTLQSKDLLNYFSTEYTAWLEYLIQILFMKYYLIVFQFGVWHGPTGSKMFIFPFHRLPFWRRAGSPAGYGSIFISHSTFSFIVTLLMPADGYSSGQMMPVLVCVWQRRTELFQTQTERFLTLEVWLKCIQTCTCMSHF